MPPYDGKKQRRKNVHLLAHLLAPHDNTPWKRTCLQRHRSLVPLLMYGFTRQSLLRCATYPRSVHRQRQDRVLPDPFPHCSDKTALKEKETYDHLLFRCTAWDGNRYDAASYTLGLITGLMPAVRRIHKTKTEYAEALETQENAFSASPQRGAQTSAYTTQSSRRYRLDQTSLTFLLST